MAGTIDRAGLLLLADRLTQVSGVARILARVSSRSLIIETHRAASAVLDDMETGGLICMVSKPKPPPLRDLVQVSLKQADMGLRARTQETLDLRTALALGLLAAAGVQLARGRIAGPATTLAITAYSLLNTNRPS